MDVTDQDDRDHGHAGHESAAPRQTPTADQQAAADLLVAETVAATERFTDVEVALEEGYIQAMPFSFEGVRSAHYMHIGALVDGRTADPQRPEGLIYLMTEDDGPVLLGVMYVEDGDGVPEIGGPLTEWHAHPELCVGIASITPRLISGRCASGHFGAGQWQMLHVWTVPNPDGPFSHVLSLEDAAEVAGQSAAQVAAVPLAADKDLQAAVSDALTLFPAEILERFFAGESLAEMAAAEGVDREALSGALRAVLEEGVANAADRQELAPKLSIAIPGWFEEQVELLLDVRVGESQASPDWTDFGYPCLDVTCLIPQPQPWGFQGR